MPRGIYKRTPEMKTGKNPNSHKRKLFSKQKLGNLYWKERKSFREIAKIYKMSLGSGTIFQAFKRLGIKWRPQKEAMLLSSKRLSEALKKSYKEGRRISYFIKGKPGWNKGFKGYYHSGSFKKGHLLIGGGNWRGGITPENQKMRGSLEMTIWRRKVFKYDNYICWICGNKSGICSHHLKRFSQYPELRFEIENGLTLCEFCHKTYTKFGVKKAFQR